MRRLLALVLTVLMLAGTFSGCENNFQYDFENWESAEQDQRTDVLTFTYEDEDLERYYELLEQYKSLALSSDSMKPLDELDPELEELTAFLIDQQSIASVLYYCDMKIKEASQRHLDMTDVLTQVQEKTNQVLREIYVSDSKLKDQIFVDWTEEDIRELLAYDSEIMELEQRNAQIIVEYQALSEEDLRENVGPLYAQLVQNNNRIAQIYGYDDYYDYAYKRVNMRDYTAVEVAQMRKYAQTYLIPTLEAAYESFNDRLMSLSVREHERLVDFLEEDYDDTEYLDLYLEALPEDVSAEMKSMFAGNVVFPKSNDAMEGAFTTLIGGYPFCYFSKGYKDTGTLVHEMGHYYGGLYGDITYMPLDLAEVQSQGNEWLMMSCMEEPLRRTVFKCCLDYRMLDDIGTILLSLIVDEFEERVYKADGVEHFTTADFERIMEEVCQNYGGYEFLCENLTDVQSYWQLVALEHPVYYVSYAVSLIPSIDLYFMASEDWDSAMEVYIGLTRELEPDAAFLEALEQAGLASPFEEKVYQSIASMYGVAIHEETEKSDLAA